MRDVPQVLSLIHLPEPPGGHCVVKRNNTGKNIPFFGSRGFRFEERNVDDPDGVFEAAGYVQGCVVVSLFKWGIIFVKLDFEEVGNVLSHTGVADLS